jgi:hypothetical protein
LFCLKYAQEPQAYNFTETVCKHLRQMYIVCHPMKIWVRIDPPHLLCHKRRLYGVVLWKRPEKCRTLVTADLE